MKFINAKLPNMAEVTAFVMKVCFCLQWRDRKLITLKVKKRRIFPSLLLL
jgi:hypothetical protein